MRRITLEQLYAGAEVKGGPGAEYEVVEGVFLKLRRPTLRVLRQVDAVRERWGLRPVSRVVDGDQVEVESLDLDQYLLDVAAVVFDGFDGLKGREDDVDVGMVGRAVADFFSSLSVILGVA